MQRKPNQVKIATKLLGSHSKDIDKHFTLVVQLLGVEELFTEQKAALNNFFPVTIYITVQRQDQECLLFSNAFLF